MHPNRRGGGVAQRAHQWVHRLAAEGAVDVLVVHRRAASASSPSGAELPVVNLSEITPTPERGSYWSAAAAAAGSFMLRQRPYAFVGWGREWAFVTAAARQELATRYAGQRWDRLVAFRLQVADYARHFVAAGAVERDGVTIDLDDVESATRASIAAGLRRCRRWREAILTSCDAQNAQRVEAKALGLFPRAAVCAPSDCAVLKQRLPSVDIEVFPNRLAELPPPAVGPAARELLFVGTLGYFPNQEAVLFAMEQLLPRLRKAGEDWTLSIVGYDAPGWLRRRLSNTAGVRFLGAVDRIDQAYRAAGIVLAPLWSGGGTKIKVLEALAYGRPLLATEHAVRGLLLRPSIDYWPADSVDEWVTGCRRIVTEPALALELGRSGRAAVAQYYVYGSTTVRRA